LADIKLGLRDLLKDFETSGRLVKFVQGEFDLESDKELFAGDYVDIYLNSAKDDIIACCKGKVVWVKKMGEGVYRARVRILAEDKIRS
jgi:hypothetical protein